ncbi:leucine-rich repeat neuronal protein 4-like [Megalops cyprinoides]|uniref:leucine-rich repeat neuronal protein 4-like n=1 Tax=Megalops cyprinoides TaxID=118141 RepID=UPI001863DE85|nr:leucine-rich repeat neuronal protein 4-like [Megalops cyprinoides]
MAARWNRLYILVALLLALSCSSSANHLGEGNRTAVLRPRTGDPTGVNTDEDYNNFEEEDDMPPTPPPVPSQDSSPVYCDYNPCLDQHPPCAELAAVSSCRCPGLSGPQEVPEPPFLQQVVQQGSEVAVHWCAPASTVSRYQVVVDGGKPQVFDWLSRKAMLKDVVAGAVVCVEAVNGAGVSSRTQVSCKPYEPQSSTSLALKAGLIGAGLGLLLLLSLVALLLWRHKGQRKSQGTSSSHPAEGVPL